MKTRDVEWLPMMNKDPVSMLEMRLARELGETQCG
jgi:hypothetical protein